MFDLTGKKALITGSSQGIGLAIAKCLSEFGADVFINGTKEDKVNSVVEKITRATAAVCDLSSHNCADILHEMTGDIDILILNASIQYRSAWDEITDETFDKQIAINLKASLKLIQKYVPYMKQKNWGRILTIGSVQQIKPHKDMLIYAASKAAQANMVMNLAGQLAPFGITVNNVAPGVIETPRNTEVLNDAAYAKKVLNSIPVGYTGMPEDCAGQVLLLCSNAGRYITGENIFIDGGMKL